AIVDIDDPGRLQRRENNMFEAADGAGEVPLPEPHIVSGSLEISNVNMVDEMTRMINGHRLYETYHKVLKGYSSISEKQEDLGTLS
ncbi:MAG: flagellar basal body rod C-terminal domain-containing protein, partial [Desulfocapsaceae bacterium]|nr:flagellar basal body rod C-terminal domain-containing protein [Desulfocapsaceae bacterium]